MLQRAFDDHIKPAWVKQSDGLFSEKPGVGLIDWTVQETRRFFTYLYTNIKQSSEKFFSWSFWRRKHQAIAKFYHYRRNEVQFNCSTSLSLAFYVF